MTEILIAGGAVMGAAAAFWLTRMQPGVKVTVIEADPSYATSSTALSAAGIRSQFTNAVNIQISRFGIDFVRDFAKWTGEAGGIADLGFRENGYLFLTSTEEGAAQMEELASLQRSLGAGTEVWDRAQIAKRFPWMQLDDIIAGSFGPRDEGFIDNMGLMAGMRNAARAAGAKWVTDRVLSFDREGDRIGSVTLEKGGRLEADIFINCLGSRAGRLMREAGIDLPVEPRKRTIFVIDAPHVRHPDAPLIIDPSGIWMRPEHDQWLAATVPADDGPCDETDFDPQHELWEDEIWPALYHRCEDFGEARPVQFWAGHYAYNTLDQNAIVGRNLEVANLYHANGFSGHGLQQAPAVGRGLAELILTGDWQTLDLSSLDLRRIRDNQPFAEAAIV